MEVEPFDLESSRIDRLANHRDRETVELEDLLQPATFTLERRNLPGCRVVAALAQPVTRQQPIRQEQMGPRECDLVVGVRAKPAAPLDGCDASDPAWNKNPPPFSQGSGKIDQMLEHVVRDDHVEGSVFKRQLRRVSELKSCRGKRIAARRDGVLVLINPNHVRPKLTEPLRQGTEPAADFEHSQPDQGTDVHAECGQHLVSSVVSILRVSPSRTPMLRHTEPSWR
jgi:hypothetical protein